jgi:hypothetical protein
MILLARQRFIHPNLWDDRKIAKLTPIERLFFIGCFSNADDEGRLIGDPAYLRSIIFKYDDMKISEVKSVRDSVLSVNKNLVLYQVAGEEYLVFTKWKEYQKPKYPSPSRIPVPPETFLQSSGNFEGELAEDLLHGMGLGRDGFGMGKGGDGDVITLPDSHSIPYGEVVEAYNSICNSLKKVRDITDKRKKSIRARWVKYHEVEFYKSLFQKVQDSDFLTGSNPRNWMADFDWIMSENNMVKILEGKYDSKGVIQNGTRKPNPNPTLQSAGTDKFNSRPLD